jgi:hypothetical protein
MMRLLAALAIFAAAIVLITAVVAGLLFGLATGRATGIAFTRTTIPTLMLFVLLVALFSYWLSGKFLP